ncbi:MAG: hypothetical protein QOJ59_5609 [Thermomicrobiales bacterium]|nr:hypothetical protein [Thermomicrobiales bacterium]MEA2528002.1 hypothetical protein [Thermomicrobiales bacterium]
MDVIEDDQPREEPAVDVLADWRLFEDAEVIDAAGESIGTVLAFIPEDPEDGRPDYIVVERGLLHRQRLFIPFDQIADFKEDTLYLKVTEDEARQNGWDKSPAGVVLSID